MDDEIEAVMMNLFKNNLKVSARLGPVPGILKHGSFIQRIKPLYFCSEDEVERYSKLKKFPVEYGYCPCSIDSQRRDVANFLEEMEKINPLVKFNIMDHFVKVLPKLRKKYAGVQESLETCIGCGEPSSRELCRACQILEQFEPREEHTRSRSKVLNMPELNVLA